MTMPCVKCGSEIRIGVKSFWRGTFEKDHKGLDPLKAKLMSIDGRLPTWNDYTLRCSSCNEPLCVACATKDIFNPSDPLVAIIAEFHGLKLVMNTDFTPPAFYILCSPCKERIGIDDRSHPGFNNCSGFAEKADKVYEMTGRIEQRARLQEVIGNYERAGEIRNQGKQVTVKNVQVDLNTLIDRLSRTGLAVPYKCPNCGAAITVDGKTQADGLRFCSYCGSAVDTQSLMRVLEATLGV